METDCSHEWVEICIREPSKALQRSFFNRHGWEPDKWIAEPEDIDINVKRCSKCNAEALHGVTDRGSELAKNLASHFEDL